MTEPDNSKAVKSGKSAAAKLLSNSDPDASVACETTNKLTPQEQMALFEKDLKENDWGHQPC